MYLASEISPLESKEKLETQRDLAKEEYYSRLEQMHEKFPNWRGPKSTAKGAFGKYYTVLCSRSCLHDASKAYPLVKSIESSYGDSIWRLELSYIRSLLAQNQLARNIARISPISIYENVMSTFAGSDLGSLQDFMDNARAYRNETMEHVRSKTNNFSTSYFTVCSEQEAIVYEKQNEAMKEAIKQAKTESEVKQAIGVLKPFSDETKKKRTTLNLDDFPRFTYRPNLAGNFKRAIPDLMLLVFINALLFALSFVAFMRYDVRSD